MAFYFLFISFILTTHCLETSSKGSRNHTSQVLLPPSFYPFINAQNRKQNSSFSRRFTLSLWARRWRLRTRCVFFFLPRSSFCRLNMMKMQWGLLCTRCNTGSQHRGALSNWPLMEEEDVGCSEWSHDPDQPAHVTRPGTQLAQVEPRSENKQVNTELQTVFSRILTFFCMGASSHRDCRERVGR